MLKFMQRTETLQSIHRLTWIVNKMVKHCDHRNGMENKVGNVTSCNNNNCDNNSKWLCPSAPCDCPSAPIETIDSDQSTSNNMTNLGQGHTYTLFFTLLTQRDWLLKLSNPVTTFTLIDCNIIKLLNLDVDSTINKYTHHRHHRHHRQHNSNLFQLDRVGWNDLKPSNGMPSAVYVNKRFRQLTINQLLHLHCKMQNWFSINRYLFFVYDSFIFKSSFSPKTIWIQSECNWKWKTHIERKRKEK